MDGHQPILTTRHLADGRLRSLSDRRADQTFSLRSDATGQLQHSASPWKVWAVIVMLAVTAIVLVLAETRHGAGLDPDGASYVAGARNLLAGRGYVDYALHPITLFPPGFSVTLAIGDQIGVQPLDAARALDALALGGLVVLTYLLARRHLRRIWLALASAGAVGLSPAVIGQFTFVMTEAIFCVVVVALLLTLDKIYEQRARSMPMIVLAAALTSVGFAYRYAGIILIPLALIIVGMSARHDGLRSIVRRVGLLAGAAAVVPLLILGRNASEGSLFGSRSSSIATVGGVVHDLIVTMGEWVEIERGAPVGLGALALVLVIVITSVGLSLAIRRFGIDGPDRRSVLPLVLYVVSYLCCVVLNELLTRIDPIGDRLLVPAFAPVVVLVAIAVDQIMDLDAIARHRWISRTVIGLTVLWLAFAFVRSANDARIVGREGQSYAARSWTESLLAAKLRELPSSVPLYTNAPDGLYLVTEEQPLLASPSSRGGDSYATTDEFAAFRHAVERSPSGVFLVWHRPEGRDYLIRPAELAAMGLEVQRVASTSDGQIYRVNAG